MLDPLDRGFSQTGHDRPYIAKPISPRQLLARSPNVRIGSNPVLRLLPLHVRSGANNGSEQPYSITSSALAKSVVETVKPSAIAVLILMTSLNFVGCSTGRSAGFAPFSILST